MNPTYYYIDESGGVKSNSKYFILGCIKTDTHEDVRVKIEELRDKLIDDPYFAFERTKILKKGLHATANHYDVRARFFSLISTLNIRAYVLLLKKDSEYYKSLIDRNLTPNQIYNQCIKKLMFDRLSKTRTSRNVVVFEQYGSKLTNWLTNVESVIDEIKLEIKNSFNVDLQCKVEVHDKNDINLAVIDYINFIFSQCYEHNKIEQRMEENFRIIEPKIGLIYKMDRDIFYHKNNRLDIKKY